MEELLGLLEQKINLLIEQKRSDAMALELTKTALLAAEAEKAQLKERLEEMELALLAQTKHADERAQERELACLAVEELIKNIDQIVAGESAAIREAA